MSSFEILKCKHCGRVCKSLGGLTNHINKCKKFDFDKAFRMVCSYKDYIIRATTNAASDANLDNNEKLSLDDAESFSEEAKLEEFSDIMQSDDCYETDDTLINQLEFDKNDKTGFNSESYKAGVSLLKLLQKSKAPLYLFDEIVKWAVNCKVNYGVNFDASTKISQLSTLNAISSSMKFKRLEPKTSSYKLQHSQEKINVVHFDFLQCLYSLLVDKDLMQKKIF